MLTTTMWLEPVGQGGGADWGSRTATSLTQSGRPDAGFRGAVNFASPRPHAFYPFFTEGLRPFNTESRGRVYSGEVDLGVLRPLPSSSRSP
jgi:hypothetical protein